MFKNILKKASSMSSFSDNLFTEKALDKDFNEYVNGSWEKNTEIPGDWSSWNSFTILIEETNDKLKAILDERIKIPKDPIGITYSLGMDTERLNRESTEPIRKYLDEIDQIDSPEKMIKNIAKFHKMGISCFFESYVNADPKESSMNRLHLDQGGLSLPERDYYLEDNFKEKRDAFRDFLDNTVSKYIPGAPTPGIAGAVLAIETRLATLHRTSVDKRDADKRYYKFTPKSFKMDMEDSGLWSAYFEEAGLDHSQTILVDNPKFFRELTNQLNDTKNMFNLKCYMKSKLIGLASSCLSEEVEEDYFKFYGTVLNGQEEQKPRWKRVLGGIAGSRKSELGELLGRYYVEKHFDESSKQRVLDMITNIEKEMSKSIVNSTWMSKQTKEKALLKLSKFTKKIGYPDVWSDLSGLKLDPEKSYFENALIVQEFEYKKEVLKIDTKVDLNEWHMNPQMINAYFNPTQNEIVFPAGILQKPFFDKDADDAVNYGGIGAVIAHEITHGYDDQGRKYDENGMMNDWWTESDSEKFTKNTDILVKQYGEYLVHDENVNGKLTLGENLADYGGLILAYRALISNGKVSDGSLISSLQSSVPNGRVTDEDKRKFFISWAHVWKNIVKKDRALQLLVIDPHAPNKYRVAAVRNLEEFYQAFDIKEDAPIYIPKEERVSIW